MPCPLKDLSHLAVDKFQILISPSAEPEAILSSSMAVRQVTWSAWPSRVLKFSPEAKSQTLIVLSSEDVAALPPTTTTSVRPLLCPERVFSGSSFSRDQRNAFESLEALTNWLLPNWESLQTGAVCPVKVFSFSPLISQMRIWPLSDPHTMKFPTTMTLHTAPFLPSRIFRGLSWASILSAFHTSTFPSVEALTTICFSWW
mmetsp:Transcript_9229/g.23696  ORF Transcript_9229/g.23696 Transcript_9229/m.23696 type:complete len:201 (+) Transcript_9229:440-1042(+)